MMSPNFHKHIIPDKRVHQNGIIYKFDLTKTKENLALDVGSERSVCQPLGRPMGITELSVKRPAFKERFVDPN